MVNWKRWDAESSTDIDHKNKRLRHELWIRRVTSRLRSTLGPPFSHIDRWCVVGAGQTFGKQTVLPLVYGKQMTTFLDPSRMVKKSFFSGMDEERRTAPPSSRLTNLGPTGHFRGCRLHSLALPATVRVGCALSLCRERRSIVAWADCL